MEEQNGRHTVCDQRLMVRFGVSFNPSPNPPLPGAPGMKAGAWPGGSPVWRKGVGRFTQEMEWNDFPWVW